MHTQIKFLLPFSLSFLFITGCSSISTDELKTSSNHTQTAIAIPQGNSNLVWNDIQRTPIGTLKNNVDPTSQGWAKLAAISKNYETDNSKFVNEVKSWKQTYPSHPGNQLIPNEKVLNELSQAAPPKHIALLLPLQGPNSKMGQAIRNGFMSAYYESKRKNNLTQTVSFYDTSANSNVSAVYQQALKEGADFIIGPLTKDKVQALSKGNISVPTLALNYTEDGWFSSHPSNLYEFGLSPLDEVQQLVDKARSSGFSKALVIVPQNAWGQNIVKTLNATWVAKGGNITDTLYFTPQTNFSQAVPALLHINPKQDRALMKEDNNKEILAKQRRQDFDVIFLLAQPRSARQIVPLLKYYYAGNVPIYSTSIIDAGKTLDSDLSGVSFVDIPWLTRSNQTEKNRLFAVGRDAFLISNTLPRMQKLPNFPVYGATGSLSLAEQQKVFRRLPWTTVHGGRL